MTERRLDSRYLCADLVRVNWLAEENESDFRTVEAVLEDISTLGGCIQVEEPIPLGAKVMISLQDARFSGRASYCVYREYGYFVGVRFSDDTKWSTGVVEPMHLTNLQTIAEKAGVTKE